jgi:hypothetical protein
MNRLARVQDDFQNYLLRGDAVAVQGHVVGSARVPIATRLGIYGGAYLSRLAEALEANFPALAKLLGEADFHTLAAAYVAGHDSPFFSIRYYGDVLPQWLATHEEYAQVPVLAELARWEWVMTGVFDAADATAIGPEALGQIPPERWAQLRFGWHPSVQRLELHWNVPQLWQALLNDEERPPLAVQEEAAPWLMWRQDLSTYFRSLGKTESAVLDAARKGWPFGELCELLCAELGPSAAPAQAAALLRGWVTSGLICSAD